MSTALVIGNMIGSGIFLLPSSLAPYGGLSVVGWLLTAIGAICLALVFAKLAAWVPKAGGPYAYTRLGFGDFAGFWIAWGYWIAIWVGNAAIAVACVSYLEVFIPVLRGNTLLAGVGAIALVWLFTWINCLGVREVGITQLVTTLCKIVPLVAIATIGLLWFNPSHFTPWNPSGEPAFSAISSVAALTLWSFIGLESATIPAGDVINPTRTIPRATLVGTGVTALVYILGTVAVMGILPQTTLVGSGAPFADAARVIGGEWAYYAVGLGAVISCAGALNGWTLLQGQIPMAAAGDRLFPKKFGVLSDRGVPVFGVVISSGLITLLLMLNYSGSRNLVEIFNFVILLATLTTLIPYVFCSIAEFIIFLRDPAHLGGRKQFRSSGIVAAIAFLYSVWAIYGSGAETVLYGFILLLFGIPVYVWLVKEQQEREGDTQPHVDDEQRGESSYVV
ncbi:MAG: amino acid permease [Leptolyngbyaceae cyanobacterium SL_7_1]|nr:amino acid permease [Leptolyngbyaceae cyanobacterium SL_7_1]